MLSFLLLAVLSAEPVITASTKLPESGCLTVRAPAAAKCGRSIELCRGETGSGSCDGYERRIVWAYLKPLPRLPDDGQFSPPSGMASPGSVLLSDVGGYAGIGEEMMVGAECLAVQSYGCAGALVQPDAGAAEREAAEANAKAACDKARLDSIARSEACQQRVVEQLAKERREVHCQVLEVNPCTATLAVRCTGRNPPPDAPALGKTLRMTWSASDRSRALRFVSDSP